MKIYLFDPDSGIYQGEDFSDAAFLRCNQEVLPEGSTPVAPPPPAKGKVLVFDMTSNCWKLKPISVPHGD